MNRSQLRSKFPRRSRRPTFDLVVGGKVVARGLRQDEADIHAHHARSAGRSLGLRPVVETRPSRG